MNTNEKILQAQLKSGYFDDKKPDFIAGLAQKAIDISFDSLSEKQKRILENHLALPCDGINDPGGFHNNCQTMLEEDELINAFENEAYYGGLLCEDCINEYENYKRDFDEFCKD